MEASKSRVVRALADSYNPRTFTVGRGCFPAMLLPLEGSATLAFRVGIGHDTHRLIPGGPLRLGGVDVPFDFQLDGHSDADVLLHALIDGLLGAAALGDIGELFPDTDPAHRGRDSADMLRGALEQVAAADFRVVNVDSIVFAERPKLSPHKDALRQSLARLLGIGADRVNVKAKTGERVGPVGRGEAISAECVVLLEKV